VDNKPFLDTCYKKNLQPRKYSIFLGNSSKSKFPKFGNNFHTTEKTALKMETKGNFPDNKQKKWISKDSFLERHGMALRHHYNTQVSYLYTYVLFFISQKMWMARRTYKKKFLYRSQAKKKMKMRRKFQSVLENQREKQVIFLDMSSHCVTWKNLGMISSEKNISFLDIFLWWVCMKAIFIHKKRSMKSSMCINMNWMYSKIKFHDIKLPFIIQQSSSWLRYNSIHPIFKIFFSWGKSTAAWRWNERNWWKTCSFCCCMYT